MKAELEREKEVLKGLFRDFEHHQSIITKREHELNSQYNMLRQQMEEQHAFQSSTQKIVEDYSHTIQQLNQSIKSQKEIHEKEMKEVQGKCDGFEEKCHLLECELDDAKDLLRGHRQEIDSRDYLIGDLQEKVRRTQRQLSQLKMETLEARMGPPLKESGVTGAEFGNRYPSHRRTTSRRSASATYPTTKISDSKLSDNLQQKPQTLVSSKLAGIPHNYRSNIR